jgi:hypothetical protein
MSSNSNRSVPGDGRQDLSGPHVALRDAGRLRSPISHRLPLQAPERTPKPEIAPPPRQAPATLPPPVFTPAAEPLPPASALGSPSAAASRRGRRTWVTLLAALISVAGFVVLANFLAPELLPWQAGSSANAATASEETAVASAATASEDTAGMRASAEPEAEQEVGLDRAAAVAPAAGPESAQEPDPEHGANPSAEDNPEEGARTPVVAAGAARDEASQARARREAAEAEARREARRQREAREPAAPGQNGAREVAPPPAEPGFLTLDAMPYATIRVEGREVGDTPIIRHSLPPGEHVVEVQFSSGEVKRMRVSIEPGDVVRRRVTP